MQNQDGSLSSPSICSGLNIQDVYYDDPFHSLYELQQKFQISLGRSLPAISLTQSVANAIYWQYCIFNELEELLLWEPTFNDPASTVAIIDNITSSVIEARMEAIDILHFIFNLGLEFGFSPNDISGIEATTDKWSSLVLTYPYSTVSSIRRIIIELIDLLPWKSWKTYQPTTMEDVKQKISAKYKDLVLQLFLVCIALGMSRQDCINYYAAKMGENIRRQSDGY